jgi:hypothetical protein
MSAATFNNEDEEAQYCLSALRDGTPSEKVAARDRLALIFSRRGLYVEATELYEANVRAGERTPGLLERLSDCYRRIGEPEAAEAALAEARKLRIASSNRPATELAPAPNSPAEQPTLTPAPVLAPTLSAPVTSVPSSATPGVVAPAPAPVSSAPGAVAPESLQAPPPAEAPGRNGHAGSTAIPSSPAVNDADARLIPFSAAASTLSVANGRPAVPDDQQPVAVTARMPATQPFAPVAAGSAVDARDHLTREAGAPEAYSAEQPLQQRRGLAVPGPLLFLGVIIFLVILPVATLALLVVNPLALYLEGRPAGPTVDVTDTAPVQLKVAADTPASWYVQSGRSVSGLWASPGLELTLEQELDGVGSHLVVTAPRPQGWGETITIVERRGQGRSNQETVLPATFPAQTLLPPAGTVIEGRITGQVTAPRLSESSQFNTTTDQIDVPVQLVVVSPPELWLDRFQNSLGMFFQEDRWLLVTIGALLTWCVVAGGAAVLFRFRQS